MVRVPRTRWIPIWIWSGPHGNCPLIEKMQQFQLVNNWSWIHRNHTFKFGADFRYLQNLRVPSDHHPSGSRTLNRTAPRGPNGGGLGIARYCSVM